MHRSHLTRGSRLSKLESLESRIFFDVTYTVIDLGRGQAQAVNDVGTVVGTTLTPSGGSYHAYSWTSGVFTDLSAASTDPNLISHADAISENGLIVGTISPGGNGLLPAQFSRGSTSALAPTDFPDQGLITSGYADAVNDSGNILLNSPTQAYEDQTGTLTNLGTLYSDGAGQSSGLAINNAGQITGSADSPTSNSYGHAFLDTAGVMTDLGTLGGASSQGVAIDSAGDVAGESLTTGNIGQHVFLYPAGRSMQDLGTLLGPVNAAGQAAAMGMNDVGQVVGWSQVGTYDSLYQPINHAFVYSKSSGSMVDLNYLMGTGGNGWTLQQADDINNKGWIVGQGSHNGYEDGFLLIPQNAAASIQGSISGAPTGSPVSPGLATKAVTKAASTLSSVWRVYVDSNDNGKLDSGEQVVYADQNGSYHLTNLKPGVNHVREIIPPGWRCTSAPGGLLTLTVKAGQTLTNISFKNTQTSLISGNVFSDVNGDKSWDAGDTGLAGWTVSLYTSAGGKLTLDATDKTGNGGAFVFDNLRAGAYVIKVAGPSGYQGTDFSTNSDSLTMAAGTAKTGVLFGQRRIK